MHGVSCTSDDSKCGCQPEPERILRKLQLTLHGDKPEQKCELHQLGADLQVVFDLDSSVLILRETIKDPDRTETSWTVSVQIDCSDMHFVNLRGLEDSSLQLTLQMRSSACFAKRNRMIIKETFHGFAPVHQESKLYNVLYLCDWPKQRIELFLPEEQTKGWKTVAGILTTFKEISTVQLRQIARAANPPPLTVLNWKVLGKCLRAIERRNATEAVMMNKAQVSSKEKSSAKPTPVKENLIFSPY